jgi:hypothetical protein
MIGVVGYGRARASDEHLPGESRVWHGVILATLGWLVMWRGSDRSLLGPRLAPTVDQGKKVGE